MGASSKMTLLLMLVTSCSLVTSLDCGERNVQCLDVYSRLPSNLPKCYCTDLCQDQLDDVIRKCSSGQVHADACGTCLTCAKAQGEKCGGNFNVLGTCATGLNCLVTIAPGGTSRERKLKEQAATGVCVSDRDQRCPRSGVTPSPANRDISCRPGSLGIIAEALYCPTFQQRSRSFLGLLGY